MSVSKGKMLWALYKKDLKGSKFEMFFMLGMFLVGNIYLYYKTRTDWPVPAGFVANFMGAGVIFLFIFFKAFQVIRSEWKDNTVYLMMSLPVSGKIIFLSKLLSLLTQWLVLEVLVGLGAWFFLKELITMNELREIQNHIFPWIKEITKLALLVFLGMNQGLLIAFFSSVVGKLVKKFSGLVTFGTFIAATMLISNISSGILDIIFRKEINELTSKEIVFTNGRFVFDVFPNDFYWVVIALLVVTSIGIFFSTAALYDRRVEL